MRDRDWTDGTPRLMMSRCDRCATVWYLPRERCPACLGDRHHAIEASGIARCVAVTTLHGAAAAGGESISLCLVETEEGPLVMGRTQPPVGPGSAVRLVFVSVDGRLMPGFVPKSQ